MHEPSILILFSILCTAGIFSIAGWMVLRADRARRAAEHGKEKAVLEGNLRTEETLHRSLRAEFEALRTAHSSLQARIEESLGARAALEAELENERRNSADKLALLEEARKKLGDSFKALSADALHQSNRSFLQLATETLKSYQESARGDLEKRQQAILEMIRPISDSLVKVDGKIAEIEKERTGAYAGLLEQVKALSVTQNQLRAETGNLVKALRAPQVRGRWGEIQLQRVVEMAGMVEYCDFQQQASVTTETGRLRPDLIVRLPGGKNVVVDAKCPLQAYLDALSCTDETERAAHLRRHAEQVNEHIVLLGRKTYWEQFQPTPEFVVLFLPGETFFSAALEQRPELIEAGADKKVILSTPTTLIALLRAVAYGWRHEQLAKNAREICELGKKVYEGARVFSEHFAKAGSSLENAIGHYNAAVGSLERGFLPSARKMRELGAGSDKPIGEAEPIERTVRDLKDMEPGDSV